MSLVLNNWAQISVFRIYANSERPSSDTTKCSILAVFTLLAYRNFCAIYSSKQNIYQNPLKLQMDSSKYHGQVHWSNKTCHRDRIARLTHHIKNFNVKLFANSNANAGARGSTIALPGLRPGEPKRVNASYLSSITMSMVK